MSTYTFTCDEGHEPETMTVEADNDDQAMAAMMEKAEAHATEKHPEMANMTDDQRMQHIKDRWTKT
jgi:hypothetical protein